MKGPCRLGVGVGGEKDMTKFISLVVAGTLLDTAWSVSLQIIIEIVGDEPS